MTPIPTKIAHFFTAYPLRTFDARQLLVRPEEPLPGVFYIVEGRVSEYDVTPSGNEVVVNGARTFHAGFFAGYVIGALIVALLGNLIFSGGNSPEYLWWTSSFAGLATGIGLYFWDLRQAKRKY